MAELQVSMSELRQSLGNLVNRVAYGRERVILVSHGQPRAAIIGIDDLERLQQLDADRDSQARKYKGSFDSFRQVRERIAAWQVANGIQPETSAETLRKLHEGRDNDLSDLR